LRTSLLRHEARSRCSLLVEDTFSCSGVFCECVVFWQTTAKFEEFSHIQFAQSSLPLSPLMRNGW
jgi:hypothetical protein